MCMQMYQLDVTSLYLPTACLYKLLVPTSWILYYQTMGVVVQVSASI